MNDTLSPKKRLFEQFARVAKSLASANRLEILEALAQGERSVEILATAVGMSMANTSHHLHILRDGGMVRSRKDGLQVFYRLSDDQIPAVIAAVRGVAERHLAEVENIARTHFESLDNLQPVRRDELMKMAAAGEVTVIDVRPSSEFDAGHVDGAINIPLDDLPQRLIDLPRTQEIVAYCRGPYCMLAFEAVAKLREEGFKARRLEDGYPEWKAKQSSAA
ncbi:MAG: metalloregulator ArsR/SmtB family transcription factor [Sulfuricella sp.]|nr:metalloregulator ArsR/SmtB family transcription factor [Sulfuricella sp.]